MSDTDTAKLLTRLASMEAELASLRRAPKEPADPTAAIRAQLVSDPYGTMSRMGIPVDHITKVLVAHAMGDSAPAELKVLAQMGPQVNATHALEAKLEALSRQVSDATAAQSRNSVRESFKALTSDKSKYPHLAKAFAKNPALFDSVVSNGSNAEELAAAEEARLKEIASAFGVATPTASDASAVNDGQGQQAAPALESTLAGSPPPIPAGAKPGLFTKEEDVALRAEIARKYTTKVE